MPGADLAKIKELIRRKSRIRFYRNKWWKFPKFRNDPKWKKPKGNDNPMRLKLKGHPPVVSAGYRTPKIIRGLHPSGLKPVVVHSIKELSELNPAEHILYISSRVGGRKRAEIINKALDLGFKVANGGREK
ncbi:MAG: 50S ribosomal protein L32e [Desulfurococcales archaeon]|nr:50S ribosomal protein L32e [Desulfurococcales archaeon]